MANKIINGCTFHHVALQTSDFEKSLKFYTEGLGFEVYRTFIASSGKRVALLDIGEGTYFEIFSDGEKNMGKRDYAGRYFHLALNVKDSKAAYARAVEYGAEEMGKAPREMVLPSNPPIPTVIGFVKGPDGEEIEFFQPL
ncbi:MAG: VOC family protein [Clostridia bacterium]|nr:VOC family protein [Clostridia bacterium]